MADLEGYLRKIESEYKKLTASDFWKEYVAAMVELRRKASRNCEIHDDVKIYQGEVQSYDRIFKLPDKLLTIVSEKDKKRATNR